MENGQSTWSHQTVVLSERDGSEEEIFLTQSSLEVLLNHPPRWNLYVNHRTSHIANQDVRS